MNIFININNNYHINQKYFFLSYYLKFEYLLYYQNFHNIMDYLNSKINVLHFVWEKKIIYNSEPPHGTMTTNLQTLG